jgi:hypothetical protein
MKKLQLLLIFLLLSYIGSGKLTYAGSTIMATPGQTENNPVELYGAQSLGDLNMAAAIHGDAKAGNPAFLDGPTTVCLNSTGNLYTTDAGQADYVWSVNGGIITAGGTSTSSTATVTWNVAGTKSISVIYSGATMTVLPVTVLPLTASIAITASATNVVAGTPVTFTATATNGGASPSYQWKVNGSDAGTGGSAFTYTPLNGDAVYCILTSNAPCVTALFTSNVITVTVTTSPLSVTVPAMTAIPGQTVYIPVKIYGAGSSGTPITSANLHITYDNTKLTYVNTVNFYPGTPVGEWFYSGNFDPEGACNAYSASATWQQSGLDPIAIPDGTTLYEIEFVYIGGNCPLNFCINEFLNSTFDMVNTTASNGAVNMVNAALSGPTEVCLNAPGNLYTTDAGKANYVWAVSGGTITSGGTSADNSATVTWNTAGSQSITVSYTGANPTALPVNVTPGPAASVSIAASSNPSCANTSVTFTATPTNGGTTPSYVWKKGGVTVGTNSPAYTYIPVNNDVVTCVMTSSEICISGNPATSNAITMTVNPLTASISITASATNVVAGTPVTFTAATGNGGTTPSYQWKVNGSDVGTGGSTFTYTPLNGDAVYCILTSNAPCVTALFTSNVITITVTTSPLVVTIPELTATPGQTVFVPVKIYGAGSSGTPITSANIHITYDNTKLAYVNTVNFYSGTPAGEWFFSGNFDPEGPCNSYSASATWQQTSLSPVTIPDGTTLYEIQFVYLGGNCPLNFCINEFLNGTFDLVNTTATNGSVNSATKTLNLKVFLEGLYAGGALMNQAIDGITGLPQFGPGIADQVNVELHTDGNYSNIAYSSGPVNLSTGGIVTINDIPAVSSGPYYITIKHRNSIETTSGAAVSFAGSTISYDFTTAATQAYGDNMKLMGTDYSIWSGDVNQDGIIDSGDMNPVENASIGITFGYVPEDVNGDGLVDSGDMNIVENNSIGIIMVQVPL